jgi:hypothetical protein
MAKRWQTDDVVASSGGGTISLPDDTKPTTPARSPNEPKLKARPQNAKAAKTSKPAQKSEYGEK